MEFFKYQCNDENSSSFLIDIMNLFIKFLYLCVCAYIYIYIQGVSKCTPVLQKFIIGKPYDTYLRNMYR
jgi:hypothetical protein